MTIEQLATVLALISSLGAVVYSYAKKDLAAYKDLDAVRDFAGKRLEKLDRRIEQLETQIKYAEELRDYRFRGLVERLDRHRADINDLAGYLRQEHNFQPRRVTDPSGQAKDQSSFL